MADCLILIWQQDRRDRAVARSRINDEFQMNLEGRCCIRVIPIEVHTEEDLFVFVVMHGLGGSTVKDRA